MLIEEIDNSVQKRVILIFLKLLYVAYVFLLLTRTISKYWYTNHHFPSAIISNIF